MLKIVKGDLIELALRGEFNIIIHGCNCFHTMGAGIAKQIAEKFPGAVDADKSTGYGDVTKIGSYSAYDYEGENGHHILVINAYTQFQPGPHAEYAAIDMFLREFCKHFYDIPIKIGIPEIGCGIGGLNIEEVKRLIRHHWFCMDVTLVEYELAHPQVEWIDIDSMCPLDDGENNEDSN